MQIKWTVNEMYHERTTAFEHGILSRTNADSINLIIKRHFIYLTHPCHNFLPRWSQNWTDCHTHENHCKKINTLKIGVLIHLYCSTRGDRVSSLNNASCRNFFDHLDLIFLDETLPVAFSLPT